MCKQTLFTFTFLLFIVNVCLSQNVNTTERILKKDETVNFNSSTVHEVTKDVGKDVSEEDLSEKANPFVQAKAFENAVKTALKSIVKRLLPMLMNYGSNPDSAISPPCMRGITKYIGALSSAKVWAIRMLDATSKPMPGLLEGTFTDYGSFDECLEIVVPTRSGEEEFKGAYCAIEARPYMPPTPKNFSLALRRYAKPLDPLSKEVLLAGGAFYYFQFRFGVCVPSTCSVHDIRSIASNVGKLIKMKVKIPKCYVDEGVILEPIHIAMIIILLLLTTLAIVGTAIEIKENTQASYKHRSTTRNILLAFSLRQNYIKLMSPSKGPGELKALHGIRALSTAWVVLGHVYVWSNFQLMRRSKNLQNYFNQLSFEAILNAWLSVESFIFLSGLLTCYGCIQMMEKTKGRIHVPFFILRRYIRLTPTFLLVMGLFFFLPLLSSGPFWYEKIDQELQSCRTHWWTNLLYINNWFSMNNICIHPTWYLAADFQLYVLSLLILYPLYRSSLLGYAAIGIAMFSGFLAVAIITYIFELPPIILISSGNHKQITDTIDVIHMRTYTHIGPYCVGMLTGYLILKYKDIKLSKLVCSLFWCSSLIVSITSLYGVHPWSIGKPPGPLITCLYAALHRTTFIAGIAWVVFACVSGRAGIINSFLCSSLFVPLSRLTYTTYLIHSLVVWTRRASERERFYFSHYTLLYEWVANWVISVLLAIPLNLLIEAPVANLDRLVFSRPEKKEGRVEENERTEAKPSNRVLSISSNHKSDTFVELKSVTTIQPDILIKNTLFNGHGPMEGPKENNSL